MRKYHIAVYNSRGERDYMTGYAMSYDECCTMVDKLPKWKHLNYKIEQVWPTLD